MRDEQIKNAELTLKEPAKRQTIIAGARRCQCRVLHIISMYMLVQIGHLETVHVLFRKYSAVLREGSTLTILMMYQAEYQTRNDKMTTKQPAKIPPSPPNMPSTLTYCARAPDDDEEGREGPPAVGLADAKPESEKFWLKRK